MAFVTYLLVVGVSLGLQKKFTPEVLGIQASSALGWFVLEVFIIFISLQILSIKSALKTFDIIAFCGYKYFGFVKISNHCYFYCYFINSKVNLTTIKVFKLMWIYQKDHYKFIV